MNKKSGTLSGIFCGILGIGVLGAIALVASNLDISSNTTKNVASVPYYNTQKETVPTDAIESSNKIINYIGDNDRVQVIIENETNHINYTISNSTISDSNTVTNSEVNSNAQSNTVSISSTSVSSQASSKSNTSLNSQSNSTTKPTSTTVTQSNSTSKPSKITTSSASNSKNTSSTTKKKTPSKTTTNSSNASKSSTNNVVTNHSQNVWVGKTGTKYHRQNCRTLRGKGHTITYKQAIAEGREPCKVCNP